MNQLLLLIIIYITREVIEVMDQDPTVLSALTEQKDSPIQKVYW